jgi:hypothetical protein
MDAAGKLVTSIDNDILPASLLYEAFVFSATVGGSQ